MHLLPRASARWGAGKRIWIKRDDLTGSALTGNKVRKLEFIAAHAQAEGLTTLVTCGGVQSNHCRATALIAAQLGLHCHVVLRADDDAVSTTGNFLLDQLAGASYEILPSAQWGRGVKEAFGRAEAACLEAGRPALLIPTGGSDSLGIWGYIAAAEELRGDLITAGIDRATVALATGSAGTQTGLTAGAVLHELPVSVVGYGVWEDRAWVNVRGSADWRASVLRWPQLPDISLVPNTRDHSVGPGYGRADPAIYALITELTRLEGIPLDPVYTGKAFHGLITDIEAGHYDGVDDIVFVHTGGIFGLFSHEAQLLRAAASASVTH